MPAPAILYATSHIKESFSYVHFDVQIGQFFGEVDPVLMITLVNTSLFSFNKTYDYQSVCDPERETKAAAGLRSVYVVKNLILLTSLENHQCTVGLGSSQNF